MPGMGAIFEELGCPQSIVEVGGVEALRKVLSCYPVELLGDELHEQTTSLLEALRSPPPPADAPWQVIV